MHSPRTCCTRGCPSRGVRSLSYLPLPGGSTQRKSTNTWWVLALVQQQQEREERSLRVVTAEARMRHWPLPAAGRQGEMCPFTLYLFPSSDSEGAGGG